VSRLGVYALANVISKRELNHKLGHRLGSETPLDAMAFAVREAM
jgi:hypothetical protein